MCKSEYKLIRKMQWDGDVLKVQDTMHDVLREAKQAAEDAMTGAVLSHFECDLSDFREYMHDKIKWEQKQWAAIPHWIPVTEDKPHSMVNKVLVFCQGEDTPDYIGFAHYEKYHGEETWFNLESDEPFESWGLTVTHWMEKPEPPKEENNDATK